MKTISLKPFQKVIGRGCQGRFFKIGNTNLGVKIIGKGFKSKKEVKKSQDYKIASLEVYQGEQMKGYEFCSQVYEECIVSYKDKYFPGIIMEFFVGSHPKLEINLDSILIDDHGNITKKGEPLRTVFEDIFLSHHLDLDDLHHENLIITDKNQVKLIDLSPRSHIQAYENGDIDEL